MRYWDRSATDPMRFFPMRYVTAVFFIALFVAGSSLLGFAFSVPPNLAAWVFTAGIVVISLAFAVPQHFLGYGVQNPAEGKSDPNAATSSY